MKDDKETTEKEVTCCKNVRMSVALSDTIQRLALGNKMSQDDVIVYLLSVGLKQVAESDDARKAEEAKGPTPETEAEPTDLESGD